jgi:hypothetical protein
VAATSGLDVGLLLVHPFHRAMLEPVQRALGADLSSELSDDPELFMARKPRVLVMADAAYHHFRRQLPDTFMVFVRHGFSHKRHVHRVVGGADFACVSSAASRDELVGRGLRPRFGWWVTGFVPMDEVLELERRPQPLPPGFAGGEGTLLYAPTYNAELSADAVLADDWIAPLRRRWPRLNVIIKPHPLTLQPHALSATHVAQWQARWRALAARHERVLLVDDPAASVYRYFAHADLLLTDVSSVMFYFLHRDRPVVLVSAPDRAKSKFYDADGPEWRWRDLGVEIERAEQLPDAVQRALERPREQAAARAQYRERIFGDLLDGGAAARVAANIRMLLRPAPEQAPWVEACWSGVGVLNRLWDLATTPPEQRK